MLFRQLWVLYEISQKDRVVTWHLCGLATWRTSTRSGTRSFLNGTVLEPQNKISIWHFLTTNISGYLTSMVYTVFKAVLIEIPKAQKCVDWFRDVRPSHLQVRYQEALSQRFGAFGGCKGAASWLREWTERLEGSSRPLAGYAALESTTMELMMCKINLICINVINIQSRIQHPQMEASVWPQNCCTSLSFVLILRHIAGQSGFCGAFWVAKIQAIHLKNKFL